MAAVLRNPARWRTQPRGRVAFADKQPLVCWYPALVGNLIGRGTARNVVRHDKGFYATHAGMSLPATPTILAWEIPRIAAFPFVVAASFVFRTTGSGQTVSCLGDADTGSGGSFATVGTYFGATTGRPEAWLRVQTGTTTVPSDFSYEYGKQYNLVLVSRGQTDHSLFCNGRKFVNATDIGAFTKDYGFFAVNAMVRYGESGAPTYTSTHYPLLAWADDRDWSDSCYLDWSLNPWQLFKPTSARSYFFSPPPRTHRAEPLVSIVTSKTRPRQPRTDERVIIDKGNPLSEKLYTAWVATQPFRGLDNRIIQPPYGLTRRYLHGPAGASLKVPNSQYLKSVGAPYTAALTGEIAAIISNAGASVDAYYTGIADRGLAIGYSASDSKILFEFFYSPTVYTFKSNDTFAVTDNHVINLRYTSSTLTVGYVDGNYQGEYPYSLWTSGTSLFDLRPIQYQGVSGCGSVYALWYWNRHLEDGERKAFAANPWQVFKLDPPRMYFYNKPTGYRAAWLRSPRRKGWLP